MAETRKSIKVAPNVKVELQAIQKEIAPGRSESIMMAYFAVMYKDQKEKRISLADHQRYMRMAEEMNNQLSI